MGIWPGDQFFATRYEYLAEYTTILRELWTTGRSNFKGKHFQMDDCRMLPTPQTDIRLILRWIERYGNGVFRAVCGL